MIEWILILMLHNGLGSDSNSLTVTSVHGFVSEVECMAAGKRAEDLVTRTVKSARYVCVRRTTR